MFQTKNAIWFDFKSQVIYWSPTICISWGTPRQHKMVCLEQAELYGLKDALHKSWFFDYMDQGDSIYIRFFGLEMTFILK